MAKPVGWRQQPARHALAAKGIRTRALKGGQIVVKTSETPEAKLQALKEGVRSEVREAIYRFIAENPGCSREYVEERIDYDGSITDIYDSSVPVYTSDIMELASLHEVYSHENELGPAFDGKPTLENITAGNIYEVLEEAAQEEIRRYLDELEHEGRFKE